MGDSRLRERHGMIEMYEMNFCPGCGTKLVNGTCHNCGFRVETGKLCRRAPQKDNNVLLIVLLSVLVFMLAAGAVFTIGRFFSNFLLTVAMVQQNQPYDDPYGYGEAPDIYGEIPYPYGIPETEKPQEDTGKAGEGEDGFEMYEASPDDEYYEMLTDSIREDLSYTISWENYQYTDTEMGIDIYVAYPVINGENVRNSEILNEKIKSSAMYYADYFRQQYILEEHESPYYMLQVLTYVTYMDEDTLSIVISEEINTDQMSGVDLLCINMDMITGSVLDNGEMIEYTDELVDEFRKQSNYQNGEDVLSVRDVSDEELKRYLADPTCNIVFHTPVGLEIGYNYRSSEGSGWVTATVKDYEKYKVKF